jgi:hypothetical protein
MRGKNHSESKGKWKGRVQIIVVHCGDCATPIGDFPYRTIPLLAKKAIISQETWAAIIERDGPSGRNVKKSGKK